MSLHGEPRASKTLEPTRTPGLQSCASPLQAKYSARVHTFNEWPCDWVLAQTQGLAIEVGVGWLGRPVGAPGGVPHPALHRAGSQEVVRLLHVQLRKRHHHAVSALHSLFHTVVVLLTRRLVSAAAQARRLTPLAAARRLVARAGGHRVRCFGSGEASAPRRVASHSAQHTDDVGRVMHRWMQLDGVGGGNRVW